MAMLGLCAVRGMLEPFFRINLDLSNKKSIIILLRQSPLLFITFLKKVTGALS